MYRIIDLLNRNYDEFENIDFKLEHSIEDLLHGRIEQYLNECCFYYSSGADATPIIECLNHVNKFIYCDIQESSNIYDSLFKLKSRVRENGCTELLYCTLTPRWFGLNEKRYNGHYGLRYQFEIKDFKAEFSLWKKENKYFIIIYIDFDNNVIWQNVFMKNKARPKMICNCAYEGGVDFEMEPLTKEMTPDFWLGYGNQYEEFELFTTVSYHGDYGGGTVDLYKRKTL